MDICYTVIMVPRQDLELAVKTALARSRAVVLTGPRQSGKTTLAHAILDRRSPNYFDLENPRDARRLEQPMDALSRLDPIGYVRYASVYKDFREVEDYNIFLADLEKNFKKTGS